MPHTLTQSRNASPPVEIIEALGRRAASLLARLQDRRRLARARKVVKDLTDEQLHDIGIDRATFVPPQPTIEVDAGLMAKLMSMR